MLFLKVFEVSLYQYMPVIGWKVFKYHLQKCIASYSKHFALIYYFYCETHELCSPDLSGISTYGKHWWSHFPVKSDKELIQCLLHKRTGC